jgi:hypothetical protein
LFSREDNFSVILREDNFSVILREDNFIIILIWDSSFISVDELRGWRQVSRSVSARR